MDWSTACPDWAERLRDGRSIVPPPIFPDQAEQALAIFKELRISDVPGKPTFGEVSEQWVFDFVAAIFGAYDAESGNQLIREFFLLISKKNSKALALDTPIPTPSGWTTMGALGVGDVVFGADGKPCRVTATSDVFTDHKCYRIGFSNGESVVADAGHLWLTSALQDTPGVGQGRGPRRGSKTRVRTTQEIAETLLRNDGARNHSLAMPAPLECGDADLPVAPYTLGAWLGDGHSACARLTCHDDDTEIRSSIEADGYPVRWTSNNGSKASTYALNSGDRSQSARDAGLAATLRKIGVLGDKHIPAAYLRGSTAQRLALLQGLMDTDGTVNQNGRVLGYCSKVERLARGVYELLATFGIKSTITRLASVCGGKQTGHVFNVQFMAFRDLLPVFRLKRKLDRMRVSGGQSARSRTVQIVSAVEVTPVPVKCITVDSQDHLFLFGQSMLPTHNSTIAAGIMLTATILCWREDEEHLILAPTKEVADNSFKPAAGMVRADPELSAIFHVQDHVRTITHRVTRASLKVVAADTETVSGKKSGRILVDEHWIFGKRSGAEAMFMEALGGQVSRNEGWVIFLSTQSDEAPAGVFKEKIDYFRDVRDGKRMDPRSLGVLYEFPADMVEAKSYMDPANFYITNPNIGKSVSKKWLVDQMEKLEDRTDGAFQQFLAKHLNIEIGLSIRSGRWLGSDWWQPAARALTLEEIIERSDVLMMGIDGGGLDDMLGAAVLGRDGETGRWLHWGRAWVHPVAMERRKSEVSRWADFMKQGDLVEVATVGDDIKGVIDVAQQLEDSGKLRQVGVDPIGISDIEAALNDIGILKDSDDKDRIIGIPQGYKLTGTIKSVERRLAEGTLIHCGQPLMAWCVGNAKVEARGNAVIITKQAAGFAKIDPLCALFNAAALLALAPEPDVCADEEVMAA